MIGKKWLKRLQLRYKQMQINRKYKSDGLTDEVLEMQVALNTERHELDIDDETERIYENFVQ